MNSSVGRIEEDGNSNVHLIGQEKKRIPYDLIRVA